MTNDNEKILKIVNMAKNGTEFEKRNAMTILEKICAKYDLNLNDLLDISELEEIEFSYRGRLPLDIAAQVAFKIIQLTTLSHNEYYLFFKCNRQQKVEFETAFNAYELAFKKEKQALTKKHLQESKVLPRAFIMRHEIFGPVAKNDGPKKKMSASDLKDLMMSQELARDMDEVLIYKQLN